MTAVELGAEWRTTTGMSFRAFTGFLKAESGDGAPTAGVGVGYAL
jgi:hypothetical protein